jgi:hypothetical protein
LYVTHRIRAQRTYYHDRGTEYRKAHDQAAVVRNLLLFGAGIAGVIGQITSGTQRAAWAIVGAVLAALAGAITGYDALMRFDQLGKVYADIEASLRRAEIEWDTAGPVGNLGAQVEHVEEILTRENGQWGQLLSTSATPVVVVPASGPTPPRAPVREDEA